MTYKLKNTGLGGEIIYDIGMNNGDDAAYYLSLGYKVIAVDASPIMAKNAELRFKKEILNKQVEILNVGIGEVVGSANFYLNNFDSNFSTFYRDLAEWGGLGYETIEIRTITLDSLIKEKGVPYYLKIDIEGYDEIAVASLKNCQRAKYLSMELYRLNQVALLKELGYSKFKIIDQHCFLPLEIPHTKEYLNYLKHVRFKTSMKLFTRVVRKLFGKSINRKLEQSYRHSFKYDHPLGSSGPFGENLPGQWQSFEGIKEIFSKYQEEYNKHGLWIDIHAKLED